MNKNEISYKFYDPSRADADEPSLHFDSEEDLGRLEEGYFDLLKKLVDLSNNTSDSSTRTILRNIVSRYNLWDCKIDDIPNLNLAYEDDNEVE